MPFWNSAAACERPPALQMTSRLPSTSGTSATLARSCPSGIETAPGACPASNSLGERTRTALQPIASATEM